MTPIQEQRKAKVKDRTAYDIQRSLMSFIRNSDIVIPNLKWGNNERDLLRITHADFIFEYEIKISRADFFGDVKKEEKHRTLNTGIGKCCPNRFWYVVPDRMVSVDEVPTYAGLIYWDGVAWFNMVKNAKLLHKGKVDYHTYKRVCNTLSYRDNDQRKRISKIRNLEFDAEMAELKREVERMKTKVRETNNWDFMLTTSVRKLLSGAADSLTTNPDQPKLKEAVEFYNRITNKS